MKKILLTIVCLVASIAMVQAVTLTWTFNSLTTPSSDPSGTAFGSVGADWVIQLVEYSGGYAGMTAGTVLGSGTLAGPPTFKISNLSTDVGDSAVSVYVRLYNATSVGAADSYVNLGVNGGSGFYATAAGSSTVVESFTAEGVSGTTSDTSARGTWIAIPEPGTMILFGLGSLVIAARRKFRK
jgi:hypothetical protein